jgi:hypothetical protein
MLVTNEDLLKEIRSLKKLIAEVVSNPTKFENVSVKKASQIMNRSHKFVLELCTKKLLPARKINTKKNKKGFTYRIKLLDLLEFIKQDEPILKKGFDGLKIIRDSLGKR